MPDPAREGRGEAIATELRKVREAAEQPARARDAEELLPPPRETQAETPAGAVSVAPRPVSSAAPPDNAAVNRLWDLDAVRPKGLWPSFSGLFRRLLQPFLDAQTAFNSRQVQLDNEILEYLERRFAETHRHYDAVLGQYGRHLEDANERHRLLQKELVAHVHDLVKRIDLTLHESERGRVSLEAPLRDLRARLARLEERLAPPSDR